MTLGRNNSIISYTIFVFQMYVLEGGILMKKRAMILPFALIAGMVVGCDGGNQGNKGTLKEKEEVKGLKLLSVKEDVSAQYDWDEYAKRNVVENYYYYDRGNSTDNDVELFNPDDYAELKGSSTQTQAASASQQAKQLKRKDISKKIEMPKKVRTASSGEKPQFDGVLNEEQFFALTSTLATAVKDNTSMSVYAKENYEYPYFAMDAGYKSSTINMTYNIYDNDIITQSSSTTQEIDPSGQYYMEEDSVYENQVSKAVGFINNRDINGTNYFVQVIHELPEDGKSEPELKEGEKYSVPNNYRVLDRNASKDPVKEYFNFQMRSNYRELLSKDKYTAVDSEGNPAFDKTTEWFSSEKDNDGNITVKYNHDVEYGEESVYVGQGVKETIYAQLDSSNRLLKYGYIFDFTYYGETLQSYDMVFSYGYEAVGDYQETESDKVIFDYTKYYDNGTLLPTVEDGNKHDEAEALLEQVNDYIIAAEVNEPTGLVREYAYSQNLSESYEEESLYDTTLYNDNVLVTYLSQVGTENNSVYAESAIIQQFNKGGNNYQIQQFYGTSRYSNGKVTTPYNEGDEPEITLLDTGTIRDVRKIYKNSKSPNSLVTAKLTASLIPEGIDEETNMTVAEHYVITLQACIQQSISNGQASLGYVYTYQIAFRLITK